MKKKKKTEKLIDNVTRGNFNTKDLQSKLKLSCLLQVKEAPPDADIIKRNRSSAVNE